MNKPKPVSKPSPGKAAPAKKISQGNFSESRNILRKAYPEIVTFSPPPPAPPRPGAPTQKPKK